MDQIGSYMMQIGTVAVMVFGATEGLGVALKQTGLGDGRRKQIMLGFALISGPAGSIIAQGAGYIHADDIPQGWALAMAALFGLFGTLLAMGGNELRNNLRAGKKGKLPR